MTRGTSVPPSTTLCGIQLTDPRYPHRRAVRMGQHVWLLLATIVTELLVITKWSKGQFTEPLPSRVKWGWSIAAALLVLYPTFQVSILGLFIRTLLPADDVKETRSYFTFLLLTHFCSLVYPARGSICVGMGRKRRAREENNERNLLLANPGLSDQYSLLTVDTRTGHTYLILFYGVRTLTGPIAFDAAHSVGPCLD